MTLEDRAEKIDNEEFNQYQVGLETGELMFQVKKDQQLLIDDLPKIGRGIRYLMRPDKFQFKPE